MDDFVEALCRGFLQNAAARQLAVSLVAPEAPTVEYLAGFGDGWEAGHVAGLALALSVITGESLLTLIEDAASQAAVETAFPVDFIVDDVGVEHLRAA
jgi:hypothetical protein